MERRRNATAGVLYWTSAPVRTSPTSSVLSEDAWEDEDEEQAEREDEFISQMDENGIIGLSEALEDVELGETCGDVDAECNPNRSPGPFIPEEGDPSGCERHTPPEELSYNLSEHLSHSEIAGEEAHILSSCYDMMGSLKAWTEDEEHLPERDKHLDMTEEEKDREEEGKRSDRNGKKHEHTSPSGKLGAINGFVEGCISKGDGGQISSPRPCSVHLQGVEPAGISNHHCSVSQSAPTVPASPLTHLLHFSAEELAAAPGIEDETFPEMDCTESLSESPCASKSLKSSSRCHELKLTASLQPVDMFSEQAVSNHYSRGSKGPGEGLGKSDKHHQQPAPSPRKTRRCSPEATYSMTHCLGTVRADLLKSEQQNTSCDKEPRTCRARGNAAGVDESSKGPFSYHTPDFSKVEPRVRFPKGGYKPPKSRLSLTRESLSAEPPLVFKSPADIVKEVLLNATVGSPAPSDCNGPTTSATNSTVPLEFRCRQQATTLLEQLQEDYNRLLTKYAEAENTIDRLRLEAKVNLYSDPPKAGHPVLSGLNHDASKFIQLDFPQAQRAEINSASLCPNGHNTYQGRSTACPSLTSTVPQLGQQLVNVLFSQTDKFLQQLQTFDDLLTTKKLKPFEQVKGLSHLAEGLDSLERGYFLARDEHKLLQQRGAEIHHFDPERELEGLIFQCGLRMDELKEQVSLMQQEQPVCEASPSPLPQPTSSSAPSEGRETLTYPQSPSVPLLVDPGEEAQVEVSSASGESSEEDEETLNSLYLKPLNDKHRCVELDFVMPVDHYQSFKELPKPLDHSVKERVPFSAALKTDMLPRDKEEERQGQGSGNNEVRKTLPRRQTKSDRRDSPVGTSKQWSSRSSPPLCRASRQSTMLPVLPPYSRRRLEVGKSHSSSLSSLGEVTASERKSSKVQAGRRRVLSQDGIISPETDSGFVGSESSHLTPAAAPSPLHQRAAESVSVPQEGNKGRPQTSPVSAPSPSSSPSHSCIAKEPRVGSRFSPNQPRRSSQGQRRHNFSYSPQHWVGQIEQTRMDSGTSEFELDSESTHTGSEGEHSDQYIDSIDSFHSSHSSSSPAACHHHGDSLRALSSTQVANCNDAMQTLQAEVTKLKEGLESCKRNKKPLSSMRAAPSAQENCSQHSTSTPRIRFGTQQCDVSGRRETQAIDEVEEVSTLRRTTRKSSASAHKQKPHVILLKPSTSQPQVSRYTQTSTAPDICCSHTTTVRSRRTQPSWQHPVASGTADEPDNGSQAPLCPQCSDRSRGRSEHCRRHTDSPTHTSCQSAESRDRAAGSRHFATAAPPALLQCIPVCTPQLLLYSSPLYVSPNKSTGPSSGIRGREEVRMSTRRSLSVDKQRSMDSSLNRAIRAARHMKDTSRHMARSLAMGLQYQELLSHSCSY